MKVLHYDPLLKGLGPLALLENNCDTTIDIVMYSHSLILSSISPMTDSEKWASEAGFFA